MYICMIIYILKGVIYTFLNIELYNPVIERQIFVTPLLQLCLNKNPDKYV